MRPLIATIRHLRKDRTGAYYLAEVYCLRDNGLFVEVALGEMPMKFEEIRRTEGDRIEIVSHLG